MRSVSGGFGRGIGKEVSGQQTHLQNPCIKDDGVHLKIRGHHPLYLAGSLRSGKRVAAIMSLIQSARMNGHDPYVSLKDVLTRLPTQRASEIEQLLPHLWVSA